MPHKSGHSKTKMSAPHTWFTSDTKFNNANHVGYLSLNSQVGGGLQLSFELSCFALLVGGHGIILHSSLACTEVSSSDSAPGLSEESSGPCS
eukprot:5513478-Amphidinium_carterae.1